MADNDWIPSGMHPNNVSQADWEFIYSQGGWLKQGGGPGSLIENNAELITWVKDLVTTNNANTIIDIGCGSLQWMTGILNTTSIAYTGLDFISSVIDDNKTNHPTHTFLNKNILDEDFTNTNTYDILICKDVLHHTYDNYTTLIDRIKEINCNHKVIIVPGHLADDFSGRLSEEGYNFSTDYNADEVKSIFIKST